MQFIKVPVGTLGDTQIFVYFNNNTDHVLGTNSSTGSYKRYRKRLVTIGTNLTFLLFLKGPGKKQRTVCHKIINIIRFSMEAFSILILIY